jgi:hypothetical protein
MRMSRDEERVNSGRFGEERNRDPRHWLDPLVGPHPNTLCILAPVHRQ